MNEDITIKNAMKTYIQMFCGICKKYDCLLHGLKSYESLECPQDKKQALVKFTPPSAPCGDNCYLHIQDDGKVRTTLTTLEESLLNKVRIYATSSFMICIKTRAKLLL